MVLLSIAVSFFIISVKKKNTVRHLKIQYHIPKGSIPYSDLDIPAHPLFSSRYQITGKPDYIVQRQKHYIPVEVKSGSHKYPLKNHVVQLGMYCLLLEDVTHTAVPFGVLVYENSSFTIPFDTQLRYDLSSTLHSMREVLQGELIERNHHDPGKCNSCSMRIFCNQQLS